MLTLLGWLGSGIRLDIGFGWATTLLWWLFDVRLIVRVRLGCLGGTTALLESWRGCFGCCAALVICKRHHPPGTSRTGLGGRLLCRSLLRRRRCCRVLCGGATRSLRSRGRVGGCFGRGRFRLGRGRFLGRHLDRAWELASRGARREEVGRCRRDGEEETREACFKAATGKRVTSAARGEGAKA